jgi:hypothetical protein
MIANIFNSLRDGYRMLSLPCSEASRLISRSMDDPLPWGQRLGMRLHVLICRLCRRYQKQLIWIRKAMHRYSDRLVEETGTLHLDETARLRMKNALHEISSGDTAGGETH